MEECGLASRSVDVVHDGEAVLDYLHRRGEFKDRLRSSPAVIVLDLKMPRLDGLSVLGRIKADPDLRRIPWWPSPRRCRSGTWRSPTTAA